MSFSNLFDAEMTASPKGTQIGWVGLHTHPGTYRDRTLLEASGKRTWFRNPSVELRNAEWKTGQFVWIRGVYFDGTKYYIGA